MADPFFFFSLSTWYLTHLLSTSACFWDLPGFYTLYAYLDRYLVGIKSTSLELTLRPIRYRNVRGGGAHRGLSRVRSGQFTGSVIKGRSGHSMMQLQHSDSGWAGAHAQPNWMGLDRTEPNWTGCCDLTVSAPARARAGAKMRLRRRARGPMGDLYVTPVRATPHRLQHVWWPSWWPPASVQHPYQ
ncbi:hypothetical protein F5148DRAFT_376534 [Russula earlei]|uniref:Uncharacterized protein n=1 Tax=Russula earlei TaxID=71964 RepID=A0ACC0UJQ6_9AGAM|nr:hypothetical protein F5148DRAFT_376534 [Russula earlei]